MTGEAWRCHLELLCAMWSRLAEWLTAEAVLAHSVHQHHVGHTLGAYAYLMAMKVEAIWAQLA